MYRYLQAHTGSFDSPAWKVEGDTHIPRLVDALARLADHVATLWMTTTHGSSPSPTP